MRCHMEIGKWEGGRGELFRIFDYKLYVHMNNMDICGTDKSVDSTPLEGSHGIPNTVDCQKSVFSDLYKVSGQIPTKTLLLKKHYFLESFLAIKQAEAN
jgi:hypothetical protein